MKKLLLAALAIIGLAAPNKASADGPTHVGPVPELIDGGFYYIYDAHGDNGTADEQTAETGCRYAIRKANAENNNVTGTHKKPVNAANDPTSLDNYSVWKAINAGEGTWKFQNVGKQSYITGTSGNVSVGEESSATRFVLEPVSGSVGTFTVRVNGTNDSRWDGNANTQMVYWGGSGHPIRFFHAAAADNDGYRLHADGRVEGTPDYSSLEPDGEKHYFLIKNVRTSKGSRGQTYAAAPAATGQIELLTQGELNQYDGRYDIGALWYYTPCEGLSGVETPPGFWPVNIYNALTGQAIANVLGGDWRTEGDEIVWYLARNSREGIKGFNILPRPDKTSDGWNNAAGSGQLVEYWAGNDQGSIFAFEPTDDQKVEKTLEAIIASRLPLAISKGNILKALDVCTDEAEAAWTEAVTAAESDDTENTINEYQAVISAYINLQKSAKPDANVRFQHKNREYEWIGVDADGSIKCLGEEGNDEEGKGTRVFTLKPVEDGSGFNLFNLSTGLYVVHPTGDGANVTTTAEQPLASVYNFDVWVNSENVPDGTIGLLEINSKPNVAYLRSNNDDKKLIRGAFNGDEASWLLEIPSDEVIEENYEALKQLIRDGIIIQGDGLVALNVTTDEAKQAWTQAKQAFEDEAYSTVVVDGLNSAYADMAKTLKETIHITAKHKSCNSKYISVNTQGNIVHADNRPDTHALTLTMTENGDGFTIFSEYAGKYFIHPTNDNDGVGVTADPAEASVYNFDAWVNTDKSVDSYLFRHIGTAATRAYLNTNSTLTEIKRWEATSGSAWFIALVDDDQAATEYLNGAKAYYQGHTFPTNVGEYGPSEAAKAAAEAALALEPASATNEQKRQAGNALRNPEMALNMPQIGHIYKFSKVDESKVLSCENRGTNLATMVDPTQANLFSTLFYLDEESRLVALEDGLVLGCFNGGDNGAEGTWQTVLHEQTAKVGHFTFAAAPTAGKYTIMTPAANGNHRYLYNASSDVNAGGSADNEGYYWTITDQGIWTPIPGTDQDRTTVVLPFAMYRKPNMTFYTAKINNGKLDLTEFTDEIIPGNVPFMLDLASDVDRDGVNHLVYLEKASSEGNEPDNNDLCGSIYAKIDTGYVVRNGNHFAPTDADFVEGFHAHIHTDKFHTISNPTIESSIDGLVGKVFAIKNTDTDNNRGYLIYNEATDAIWTSGKAGDTQLAIDDADTEARANSNYHWTLVKDNNGLRYLYNIAAGKFAACYTEKGSNGGECEFVWHFADYPTAIDFCFLDYDMSTSLEGTTFNILGGEKTGAGTTVTRPAGMQIMNNNATHPVPGIAGHEANDGCGFMVIVIEDATASEVASADEALAAMEAEHSAAAEYIAGHTEELTELPGHYNADGYAAFTGALAGTADDSQAKYYKLVRARNAAGNNITEFADDQAYIIEGKYASIYWQGSKFYVDVETTDTGNADEYSNVWLCTKSGDNVNFTHTFQFKSGVTGEQIDRPAAARARFAPEAGTGAEVSMFAEHSAPAYKDGLGNISVADTDVKVLAKAEADDATTTGIREISAGASDADKTVYDLQGRRINRATRGLYIVDGVKTLVK